MTTPETGIVLLAAGRGTRFGDSPKLLADLDGRPLVRHAAEAALATGLAPVVVVLGAHAAAVRAALDGLPLRFVENPDFAAGLSTSLQAGLAALPERCAGAVVMLGDMPRVAPAQITRLAAATRDLEAAELPARQPRPAEPAPPRRRTRGPDGRPRRRSPAGRALRRRGDRGRRGQRTRHRHAGGARRASAGPLRPLSAPAPRLRPAPVGAVAHLLPDPLPLLAPGEGPPALRADLLGKVALAAHWGHGSSARSGRLPPAPPATSG